MYWFLKFYTTICRNHIQVIKPWWCVRIIIECAAVFKLYYPKFQIDYRPNRLHFKRSCWTSLDCVAKFRAVASKLATNKYEQGRKSRIACGTTTSAPSLAVMRTSTPYRASARWRPGAHPYPATSPSWRDQLPASPWRVCSSQFEPIHPLLLNVERRQGEQQRDLMDTTDIDFALASASAERIKTDSGGADTATRYQKVYELFVKFRPSHFAAANISCLRYAVLGSMD